MSERLIVDGMNVLGSRPDGWWRDRPAAMERLTRRLDGLSRREGVEVTVVFDGREHARVSAAAGSIEVAFAPGGRDAADGEIVRRIGADPDPASIVAITSDRRLRARVKAVGASSSPAGELLRRLRRSEGSPENPSR